MEVRHRQPDGEPAPVSVVRYLAPGSCCPSGVYGHSHLILKLFITLCRNSSPDHSALPLQRGVERSAVADAQLFESPHSRQRVENEQPELVLTRLVAEGAAGGSRGCRGDWSLVSRDVRFSLPDFSWNVTIFS